MSPAKHDPWSNIDLSSYPDSGLRIVRERKTVVDIRSESNGVNIDFDRLIAVSSQMKGKDWIALMHVARQLEDNNKPVRAVVKDILKITGWKAFRYGYGSMKRLVEIGIIKRQGKNQGHYYVNPMYIWVGDRSKYIDPACIVDE